MTKHDAEREAFEKWAISVRLPCTRVEQGIMAGNYVNQDTQVAWVSWNTRAQQQDLIDTASTDTTRKIATLRKWGHQEKIPEGRISYLVEIGDEMERIYNLMIEARAKLFSLQQPVLSEDEAVEKITAFLAYEYPEADSYNTHKRIAGSIYRRLQAANALPVQPKVTREELERLLYQEDPAYYTRKEGGIVPFEEAAPPYRNAVTRQANAIIAKWPHIVGE